MKVGGREIVQTGVVVAHFDDNSIELEERNLKFRLLFKEEPKTEPKVDSSIVEGRLELTLINFNNSLGTSWFGRVGYIAGKQLFLSLAVHAIGNERLTRSVGFTFSTGENA